jgi:hypothetical protein
MSVKKKATSPAKATEGQSASEDEIERVIQRGGKTAVENRQTSQRDKEKRVTFLLRVPADLVEGIDVLRKSRPGTVSRNQLIIEAIAEMLTH